MTKKFLFILLLFSFVVLSSSAKTNETATPTSKVNSEVKAEVQNKIETASLKTPRATVRTFMNTMNDVQQGKLKNINSAIKTLYTDELAPENKEAKSIEMANQLFKILNSFTFKIDAIPEKLKSRSYTLQVGQEIGIKIVLHKYDDGNWRFNYKKTLENLPSYIKLIKKNIAKETEDPKIDPVFKSPRATMNYFFTEMRKVKKEGPEKAILALDMSRFEKAVSKGIGAERIAMLKTVIDRYKFVDLVEIPNDPEGAPYVFLNNPAGRIVIEKVNLPDSNIKAWKFSAQTVADLPKLYDAFKDLPIAKGVNTKVDIPISVKLRDYMKKNFPELITKSFLLENWQWLGIFIVIFIGLGVSKFITNIIKSSIGVVFKREALKMDVGTEARFIRPIRISLTSWGWWIGISALGLPAEARLFLLVTVKVITAIAAIWAGYRLMDVVGNYLQGRAEKTENKFDDLLVPLVTRSLKTLFIAIGIVFIADIFALDINKLLAGLGIGGLAFALAAKDTISNVFGSLTILIDRPFQIGDWVTIGKADGSVESVGVRSTRIRTFHNSLITIPNSQLINATIDNWGARKYRRITSTLGLAYDTPPEKIDAFCEGVRELIRKHPYTRKDYYLVYFNGFGSTCLNIMLYCFVETPDWQTELREKHRLFSDIMRVAKKLKVEFAFPTQTLYLRQEETPVHDNTPDNQKEAFETGQREADTIIANTLGIPPVKPPPATFD